MNSCSEVRPLLGVFVIGSIDPTERALVEEHLATCRRCRDELASLAGLPALLGRVTEEQISEVTPPPERMLDALLTEAARRRGAERGRTWTRILVAAAVGLLMLLGGSALGMVVGGHEHTKPPVAGAPPTSPHPSPAPTWTGGGSGPEEVLSTTDQATGVWAQLTLFEEGWGTKMTIKMHNVPRGDHCQLVAVANNGREDIAGSWTSAIASDAYPVYSGSTMTPYNQITSIQVRTIGGHVLVSIPV